MYVKGIVKTGEYFDSVSLMLVARDLTNIEGVVDATVVMGTEENKQILKASDMLLPEFTDADDTDLLIAGKSEDETIALSVIEKAEVLLKETKTKKSDSGEYQPKSIEGAVKHMPNANMLLISVSGRYAGDVAQQGLEQGLHVMLFSDNVPVEKEIELKKLGAEKGLLVMGPDCGTAIINNVPLCFANVVNKGNIGIVGASGTGLQEISSVISNAGVGISQAIGTGGRDVKKEVGGIMFIEGMKALAADDNTKVICLVSKPPHPDVTKKIADVIKQIDKPVTGILIGGDPEILRAAGATPGSNIEEAGLITVALSKGESIDDVTKKLDDRNKEYEYIAEEEVKKMSSGQKYLRGLFSGGTLCDETQLLFKETLGDVYSPAPINPDFKLEDIWKSYKNTVVDLGEDEFTVGRPHPMIDFELRKKRIVEEAKDPETAIILLDVVLGYGSNMHPEEELAPVIKEAKEIAEKAGRYISIISAICGTDKDPQNKEKVANVLKDAGSIIMPSNAAATKLCINIIKQLGDK